MKTYHYFIRKKHFDIPKPLLDEPLQIFDDKNKVYVDDSSTSYVDSIVSTMKELNWPIDEFLYYNYDSNYDESLEELLKKVPVFLVHTNDSGKIICIKPLNKDIKVPEDNHLIYNELSDIDKKVLGDDIDDLPNEKTAWQGTFIYDLLGVYIYDSKPADSFNHKIFIWVDKIENCANKDSDKTKALFELVLFHEVAHALMDVHLYGLDHAERFTYAKDRTYRIIEETLADCFALLAGKNRWKASQIEFLTHYLEPWCLLLYGNKDALKVMRHWMLIKRNFDSMPDVFINRLKEFWSNKDFSKLY